MQADSETMARADPGPGLDELAQRLCLTSERRSTATFARVSFPEQLDRSRTLMPADYATLRYLPIWESLDPDVRWRLGLLEAVNFFSLNIHGEQALVAALVERLYRRRWPWETASVSRFLQHFIHEENSHTYMLAEFCVRYHGQVMPELVWRFEQPKLSPSGLELLFFGRLYVLESLLDKVNRAALSDPDLDETVRSIHRSHHLDEALHLAFDRAVIAQLAKQTEGAVCEAERAHIERLCRQYADYASSRLVNPRVYRELGLAEPLQLAEQVRGSDRWRELMSTWQQEAFKLFRDVGVFAA